MERRYDIDWVRVIAIGLLLIYHIAIGFQPWGTMIWFITNGEPLTDLWIPMSILNVWRIPLLFFVSGMGVSFAMRRRTIKELFVERTKRILVPFIFGFLIITPVHILLFQDYMGITKSFTPGMGHLWFLGNIFVYVLVLSPIFYALKHNENSFIGNWVKRIFGHPTSMLILIAGFMAEAFLINPASFETYAYTWHGFFLGLLAFFFGFCCVFAGQPFWNYVVKWRLVLLTTAFGFFLGRMVGFNLAAPNYLLAIESVCWILTVFGFTSKYLNKPSRSLSYLSEAAYPVYIIHMIFLYLASWLIFPLDLVPPVKLVMVIFLTFGGCLLTYEYAIKRIIFLRPLFGLKTRRN